MNSESARYEAVNMSFDYPLIENAAYRDGLPFPHSVIMDAWDAGLIRRCKRDVEQFSNWAGEKNFFGSKQKRFCGDIQRLPKSVITVVQEASSAPFLQWLEKLTGERGLLPDPYLEGGGIHQIGAGGFLKIHADFNWNKRLSLFRRLNVLIYLNPDWRTEWGGALELWNHDMSACSTTIYPKENTMVVFTTDEKSFHGHPDPLSCPSGITRDSIALYYYSATQPSVNFSACRVTTDYRLTKGDEL